MANQYTYKPPFTKQQIEYCYILLGMTQVEVALEFGTSQKVVWRAMKKWNIPKRKTKPRNQKGELSPTWKGSSVGYAAFHKRIEVLKGRPKKCEICGTTDKSKTYDWANLSGQHDNPKDYKRMCRSCHWKYDKKILNIKHMRKRCLQSN